MLDNVRLRIIYSTRDRCPAVYLTDVIDLARELERRRLAEGKDVAAAVFGAWAEGFAVVLADAVSRNRWEEGA